MSNKTPMDLDTALGALARRERSARPEVSANLHARVLTDAAAVSAEIAAERRRRVAAEGPRRAGGGLGILGRLRALDLWTGAAVAAALLCLAVGLGVGYQAGDELLAGTGLGEDVRLAQAGEGDPVFLSEDVL